MTLGGIKVDHIAFADGTSMNTASSGGQVIYDAIVDASGNGDYTSVLDAITDGKKYIFVKQGDYTTGKDTGATWNLDGHIIEGDFPTFKNVKITVNKGSKIYGLSITYEFDNSFGTAIDINNLSGGFLNIDYSIIKVSNVDDSDGNEKELISGNPNSGICLIKNSSIILNNSLNNNTYHCVCYITGTTGIDNCYIYSDSGNSAGNRVGNLVINSDNRTYISNSIINEVQGIGFAYLQELNNVYVDNIDYTLGPDGQTSGGENNIQKIIGCIFNYCYNQCGNYLAVNNAVNLKIDNENFYSHLNGVYYGLSNSYIKLNGSQGDSVVYSSIIGSYIYHKSGIIKAGTDYIAIMGNWYLTGLDCNNKHVNVIGNKFVNAPTNTSNANVAYNF